MESGSDEQQSHIHTRDQSTSPRYVALWPMLLYPVRHSEASGQHNRAIRHPSRPNLVTGSGTDISVAPLSRTLSSSLAIHEGLQDRSSWTLVPSRPILVIGDETLHHLSCVTDPKVQIDCFQTTFSNYSIEKWSNMTSPFIYYMFHGISECF